MPLEMGGVETERAQSILFDPVDPAQVAEARARCDALLGRGFRVREEREGELVLDPPERDRNVGVFRILSENGDDRVTWRRTDADQVRDAYKKFRELQEKGYTAYAVNSAGKKGHRLENFDPGLEEIIMVPSTMPG